jgi:uncharacterized membrane protein
LQSLALGHCLGRSFFLRKKYPFFFIFFLLLTFTLELLWRVWSPSQSMDFVAPWPWVTVFAVGIFAGQRSAIKKIMMDKISLPHSRALRYLCVPGKHSLMIYLIHQPFLFALLLGVRYAGILVKF